MIRKILFSIFFVYTLIWFSVAYTIKGKVVDTIKNSETDNIKISYSQVRVSGFPTKIKVGLIEPKIKFIDHINSKELSAERVKLLIDFNFETAKLILIKDVKQQDNFGDKSIEYVIQPKDLITASIKLNKPLYKLSGKDTLKSIINFVEINNQLLSVTHENKEIFNIANFAFLISKENSENGEDISLKLRLSYESQEDFLNFKKAKLDLDTILNIGFDPNKNIDSINNLAINHLIFTCDDNSEVNLVGSLGFFDDKLPKGKLSFELTNYHDVIDKLMPNNMLLPKRMAKIIIERAVNSSSPEAIKADDKEVVDAYEKIKFDVEFSNNGINIGSVNLLDLKIEDNDKVESSDKLKNNDKIDDQSETDDDAIP